MCAYREKNRKVHFDFAQSRLYAPPDFLLGTGAPGSRWRTWAENDFFKCFQQIASLR